MSCRLWRDSVLSQYLIGWYATFLWRSTAIFVHGFFPGLMTLGLALLAAARVPGAKNTQCRDRQDQYADELGEGVLTGQHDDA